MADSEQTQKLTVGYWDIRGLAQPIRMALTLGGVDFNDVTYECRKKETEKENPKFADLWDLSDWHGKTKSTLGIDFCNLPYVQDEGVSFAESIACLTYAAEVGGHHAKFTQAQKAKALAFTLKVQEIRDKAVGFFYGFGGAAAFDGVDGANTKAYIAKITKEGGEFDTFNAIIGEKKYLMGDDICSADFHLCEMIYQHYLVDKAIFEEMGNLKRYAKGFFALEKIADMEKNCKFPINNKMAKFGAEYISDVDLSFGM